jgi:hypothetical protein
MNLVVLHREIMINASHQIVKVQLSAQDDKLDNTDTTTNTPAKAVLRRKVHFLQKIVILSTRDTLLRHNRLGMRRRHKWNGHGERRLSYSAFAQLDH